MTLFLSTLTLGSNIALILGVTAWMLALFTKRRTALSSQFFGKFFAKNARILACIVALTATLGSLYFSEIAKYEPCKLCWYQRILMYPQTILLGLAILINDRKHIATYCIALSGIGAIIALYHYYLQRGGSELIPCSTVGYSVSCAKVFTMSYDYITIPFMSFSAFALILVLMMFSRNTST